MTKRELVAKISEGRKKLNPNLEKTIRFIVDKVFDIIAQELVRGERVQIIGFGTFEVKERKSREGRNPRTGERIDLSASKRVFFKQGRNLKRGLNHDS